MNLRNTQLQVLVACVAFVAVAAVAFTAAQPDKAASKKAAAPKTQPQAPKKVVVPEKTTPVKVEPEAEVLTAEERRQAALAKALEENGMERNDLEAARARRARQAQKARKLGLAAGQLPNSHNDARYAGSGSTHTIAGSGDFGASGRSYTFAVQIEDGLAADESEFSALVNQVLGDSRSWVGSGKVRLSRTSGSSYDFRIVLASPAMVDALCAPLTTDGIYSCRNGKNVMLNYYRWVTGAYVYPDDLAQYRIYMINHEVGHALGQDHRTCPGSGAFAPVMVQQSISTYGCVAQPWPMSSESSTL